MDTLLEDWRRIVASLTQEEYDYIEHRLELGWVYGAKPLFPVGADTEVAVTSVDAPVDGQGSETAAATDVAMSEARERGSRLAIAVGPEVTAEIQQQRDEVDRFMESVMRERIWVGVTLSSSSVFRQVRSSWNSSPVIP